jgi:hypothetical protein
MNFNLIISDPANQDLEQIADYLGMNYGLNRSETGLKVDSGSYSRLSVIRDSEV